MQPPAHERLKAARLAAGYGSAREAAKTLRMAHATYLQHENGAREMTVRKFEAYVRFFHHHPRIETPDAP
jgi:hypothetical protein